MMRLAPLLLALVLAGCAVDIGGLRTPPASPPPSTAERLLASMARLRALDDATLAAEASRARQAAPGPDGDFARVEAALALSFNPAAEEADIQSLLAPVLHRESSADPELQAMAGFLHVMSVEHRTLRDTASASQAKAREDRREAQTQRARADAQQERAERLQQKLDALTNLEKSLAKRRQADDPSRRPR